MKKVIVFLSVLLLGGMIYVFSRRGGDMDKLVELEKSESDSTGCIIDSLRKMDVDRFSSREKALYYLLFFRSRKEQKQIFLADSLINVSIQYYKKRNDSLRLFQAYYLKGQICDQLHDFIEAFENYQKAKDYSVATGDNRIKSQINHRLGEIYHFKMMDEEERIAKKDELKYALLENDTLLISRALRCQAKMYDNLSDSDLHLELLNQAWKMVPSDNSELASGILRDLCQGYLNVRELDSALYYANKAIDMGKEREDLFLGYHLKAEAYYLLNQNDSAEYYFKRSLASQNLKVKVSTFYDLYELARGQGDKEGALRYLELHIQYRDSLRQGRREDFLDNLQNIQAYKREKQRAEGFELQLLKRESRFYQLMFVASLAILVLLFSIYSHKNEKKRQERRTQLAQQETTKALLARKELEYQLLQEKEVRKKQELQRVNLKMEYYKRLNEITLPIFLKERKNNGIMKLNDKEWELVIKNTDACFDRFTQRLKENFSCLTEDDVRFCCLVKMELRLSLLADIYHIEKGSISRRKMRMKEKMGITRLSLDDFIKNF